VTSLIRVAGRGETPAATEFAWLINARSGKCVKVRTFNNSTQAFEAAGRRIRPGSQITTMSRSSRTVPCRRCGRPIKADDEHGVEAVVVDRASGLGPGSADIVESGPRLVFHETCFPFGNPHYRPV